MNKSIFEIVTTTTGAISIRNTKVNEIMHNPVGPWIEANALYIDQSKLKNRLVEPTQEKLVIYDVGLGAAANSVAAMACSQSLGPHSRPLHIVSFERDIELLKFTLFHAEKFSHLASFQEAIQEILEKGEWSNDKITWELRQGDFIETIESEVERPHLVFFDPYSPNVNQEMWTTECFKKIRARSRDINEGGTSLYTYSLATRVRVALINAGFFVGYGQATGLKSQTTEAATALSMLRQPLDVVWFERWQRSNARYPYDCLPENQLFVDQQIKNYFSELQK